MHGLARQLVLRTDDSGLSDTGVLDQRRLDLGGRETVAGDVNDVVDTALDPDVSVLVANSTIASVEVARVGL